MENPNQCAMEPVRDHLLDVSVQTYRNLLWLVRDMQKHLESQAEALARNGIELASVHRRAARMRAELSSFTTGAAGVLSLGMDKVDVMNQVWNAEPKQTAEKFAEYVNRHFESWARRVLADAEKAGESIHV